MTLNPVPPVVEGGAIIIGPSGAGKTALLATLPTAATLASPGDPGLYAVFPGNEPMRALSERTRRMVITGQLDAHLNPTDQISEFQLLLRCREKIPPPAATTAALNEPAAPPLGPEGGRDNVSPRGRGDARGPAGRRPPILPPRAARLAYEQRLLREINELRSFVTVEETNFTPDGVPDGYLITFRCNGYEPDNAGGGRPRDTHAVQLTCGPGYPGTPPIVVFRTPVWHPDVAPDGAVDCGFGLSHPETSLVDVCRVLYDLIRYRTYTRSRPPAPLNRGALRWVLQVAEPRGHINKDQGRALDDRPFPHPPPTPPAALIDGHRDYPFRMIDGPGGALFATADREEPAEGSDVIAAYRSRLAAQGRASDGLMICLDATDPKCGQTFFLNLPQILHEMATTHLLRASRVALVLTKADRVCEPGPGAQAKLEARNPWDTVDELIGADGIQTLLNYLRPEVRPNVHCSWSSVYGFGPEAGAPNFNRDTNRMLGWEAQGANAFHTWRPFRVLDPFVFLATGRPLGLTPLPDTWLPR
ncbi:MAG TPA: hypothetical protein VGE74_08915 [Gemmata sp.]